MYLAQIDHSSVYFNRCMNAAVASGVALRTLVTNHIIKTEKHSRQVGESCGEV